MPIQKERNLISGFVDYNLFHTGYLGLHWVLVLSCTVGFVLVAWSCIRRSVLYCRFSFALDIWFCHGLWLSLHYFALKIFQSCNRIDSQIVVDNVADASQMRCIWFQNDYSKKLTRLQTKMFIFHFR